MIRFIETFFFRKYKTFAHQNMFGLSKTINFFNESVQVSG